MDKTFQPSQFENKLYDFWQKKGFFTAKIDKKSKSFSIILPPPNANADLHMGHAMYVYEDVMIRYHKLKGFETLWLPGADHAGFETQYVFEKQLQKEGKSRFDFDRETLFKMIWDFVEENRGKMENQLRRLGFSLDWSKEKYTMDPDIVKIVYQTFKQMFDQGLVYRKTRLVNYCVHDGTSFSDLEAVSQEKEGELYFVSYQLEADGTIEVATTRPETILGDTAIAVNPKDKRYKNLIGKKATVPIVKRKIPIIADESVDLKFGTGAVKVTPAHDEADWKLGKKHNLQMIQVIGFDGRIKATNTELDGLKIIEARQKVIAELKLKSKKHNFIVKACYKCGRPLEPLPLEQWWVKIRPLADQAKKLVQDEKIRIYPKRFKKQLLWWLENFHDWNISRQLVWGIRIPAWKCAKCGQWAVTSGEAPSSCPKCQGPSLKQDEDTFDTWFSSSQWPYATLEAISKSSSSVIASEARYHLVSGEAKQSQQKRERITSSPMASRNDSMNYFDYFYPTSVMETGYDILPWWVARMIMIDYFSTKKIPFKLVFLHGLVRDKKGKKMSKSRGNVINPIVMVEKYGADSLRAALIFGTKEGNDLSFSEEKIVGMRNFANKIWNIGRFIYMSQSDVIANRVKQSKQNQIATKSSTSRNDKLKQLSSEFQLVKKQYFKFMDGYRFSAALEIIYEFLWHRFADFYVEQLKEELRDGSIEASEGLKNVYFSNLKLLHPFMPYVTDAVWQIFHGSGSSILENQLKD